MLLAHRLGPVLALVARVWRAVGEYEFDGHGFPVVGGSSFGGIPRRSWLASGCFRIDVVAAPTARVVMLVFVAMDTAAAGEGEAGVKTRLVVDVRELELIGLPVGWFVVAQHQASLPSMGNSRTCKSPGHSDISPPFLSENE